MNLPDFKRLIRPLARKIFLLLGRAILEAVDNSEGTQKIQITALEGEIISDMERFQEYGFETYPFTDSEVISVFFNGNRDHGIALCVHDRRYRPKYLSEGEIVFYTDEDLTPGDFHIHFKRNRIFDIKGDKEIKSLDTSEAVTVPTSVHVNVTSHKRTAPLSIYVNTTSHTRTALVELHTNATGHTVTSPQVSLGTGTWATSRKLMDERFVTLYNTHIHGGPGGIPSVLATSGNQATASVRGL